MKNDTIMKSELDPEKDGSPQNSNLNLVFDNVKTIIENQDLPTLQYFLDELNEFLVNVCSLLDGEFKAAQKTNNLLYLQVSEPFSYTYSSQTTTFFDVSNFYLVPKSLIESKEFDSDVEPFELCETNLDNVIVKEEEDDEDFLEKPKKKQSYVRCVYKEEFPITKEQFDELVAKGTEHGNWDCPACTKPFARKRAVMNHLLTKCKGIPMIWPKWRQDEKSKKFFCQIEDCTEQTTAFVSRASLKKHHYDLHAPQAKENVKCEFCWKTFSKKHDLKKHIEFNHDSNFKNPFICKFCGKSVKTKAHLQEHEASHLNQKAHICSQCGFRTSAKSSLRRHIKGVHDHSTEEVCETCGKSFNTKLKLRRHMVNSHSDIGEKCPFCGKIMRNLKRHIFSAHNIKYKCPECPREFQAVLGVEQHRKEVHGYGVFKSE